MSGAVVRSMKSTNKQLVEPSRINSKFLASLDSQWPPISALKISNLTLHSAPRSVEFSDSHCVKSETIEGFYIAHNKSLISTFFPPAS